MKVMYHCTHRKNLLSILQQGLLPHKPDIIQNAVKGVYLSKQPFDWMYYVTKDNTEPGAMLTINVDGLELNVDEGINKGDYQKYPAFFYEGTILPNRIVGVSVSTKDHPMSFKSVMMERPGKLRLGFHFRKEKWAQLTWKQKLLFLPLIPLAIIITLLSRNEYDELNWEPIEEEY